MIQAGFITIYSLFLLCSVHHLYDWKKKKIFMGLQKACGSRPLCLQCLMPRAGQHAQALLGLVPRPVLSQEVRKNVRCYACTQGASSLAGQKNKGNKYRAGQKLRSGFSITSYGKTQTNILPNPIQSLSHRNSSWEPPRKSSRPLSSLVAFPFK